MAKPTGKMPAVARNFIIFMIASVVFFAIVLVGVIYYGDDVPWKPKSTPSETTPEIEPTPSPAKS